MTVQYNIILVTTTEIPKNNHEIIMMKKENDEKRKGVNIVFKKTKPTYCSRTIKKNLLYFKDFPCRISIYPKKKKKWLFSKKNNEKLKKN